MSLKLSFSVEGEKQLVRKLHDVGKKDFKKEFDDAGDKLIRFFSGENFTSEGSAIGEPWVGGPRYNKLQRTGKMRRSFKKTATGHSLLIENTTDYFKYHQSRKPRTKLPRRVMLKLDEPRRQIIVKSIQKSFEKRLKGRI